ncbi:MAG: hypothetical protein ACRDT4_23795, partial [Micromonosporaceae bacterium]
MTPQQRKDGNHTLGNASPRSETEYRADVNAALERATAQLNERAAQIMFTLSGELAYLTNKLEDAPPYAGPLIARPPLPGLPHGGVRRPGTPPLPPAPPAIPPPAPVAPPVVAPPVLGPPLPPVVTPPVVAPGPVPGMPGGPAPLP